MAKTVKVNIDMSTAALSALNTAVSFAINEMEHADREQLRVLLKLEETLKKALLEVSYAKGDVDS